MKRKLFLFIALLTVALYTGCGKDNATVNDKPPVENPGDQKTDKEQIEEAEWETQSLSGAIAWKYHHFTGLFSSKQSITVFEIDLNNENVKIDIPFVRSGTFLKTSEAGVNTRATAAINGSYFSTGNGGSTVFFRKDGEIITRTVSGFDSYRENAGFAISQTGEVSVVKRPTSGWESVSTSTLLASGPLLVYDGKILDQVKEDFTTGRNPRTAVGLTKDKHLIAVVADGRTYEAAGMTTTELATVMDALGCESAMNLDGGGSSTAWVKNRGVVNYPSDNSKFDHEGERAVATVIAFIMTN